MKRYIELNISVPNAQSITGQFKQVFRDKVKLKDNQGNGKIELNDCSFKTDDWDGKKFRDSEGKLITDPVMITAWIVDADADLFKFKDQFEWVSGYVRLWEVGTDILVTKDNYMNIRWQDMTSVQPVVEE